MSLKQSLINALPPFLNERKIITQRQGTEDIINYMCSNHGKYQTDYDKIYTFFDTGNVYNDCNKIWSFLKYNLVYNAESGNDQSVKSPSAILAPGQKIDCKHYSLFAAGVLDAIRENDPDSNFDWCFRFVSDKSRVNVSHVFVVVFEDKKEIWLDACLTSFDQRKKYLLTDDVKPMPLYEISGVNDNAVICDTDPVVIVPDNLAWESFLALVHINFLGLKDLMRADMATTGGEVKSFLLSQGFDYDQLINFLNG